MNKLNQHEVQFDYFSSNYDQFEKDFYKYSALNVPLTFLIDDILNLMVNNNSNFFRLTANKSKDKRDHYFFFKVRLYTKSGAWKNSSPGFQFLYTKRQISNIIKV